MYEELYTPLPDVDTYLGRIDYDGPRTPTREALDALVWAHLTHIPFEDLDPCDRGIVPDLGIAALFDKVVTRGRGGYCFELNALFAALLRTLGFSVDAIAARVDMASPLPVPTLHRGNVVALNGERLWVDVGFGGPAPAASLVLVPDVVQHTPSGDFSFERLGGQDGCWQLVSIKQGARTPTIAFRDQAAEEVDFLTPNWYVATHPGSRFKEERIVNLLTATGSRSLTGNVLRERDGDQMAERTLQDDGEVADVLRERFGIAISG